MGHQIDREVEYCWLTTIDKIGGAALTVMGLIGWQLCRGCKFGSATIYSVVSWLFY